MHDDLTEIPSIITGGTTVSWRRTYDEFSAGEGWSAKLYLAGASVFNKAATASGSDFIYTLTAAETSALLPGGYGWWERVSQGGLVYEAVEPGRLTIAPDPATATAGSMQAQEEKDLAAIRAFLSGNATVKNYTIGDRSLEYHDQAWLAQRASILEARIEARRHPGRIAREVRVCFGGLANE